MTTSSTTAQFLPCFSTALASCASSPGVYLVVTRSTLESNVTHLLQHCIAATTDQVLLPYFHGCALHLSAAHLPPLSIYPLSSRLWGPNTGTIYDDFFDYCPILAVLIASCVSSPDVHLWAATVAVFVVGVKATEMLGEAVNASVTYTPATASNDVGKGC
jgi:hypothetical protein